MNISYLTPIMREYIDAPIPYIVGIPRDIWNQINSEKLSSFPPDVAIYDIDKMELTYDKILPNFPEKDIINIYNLMLNIVKEKRNVSNVIKDYKFID